MVFSQAVIKCSTNLEMLYQLKVIAIIQVRLHKTSELDGNSRGEGKWSHSEYIW